MMAPRQHSPIWPNKRQSGVALIEVLISVLIFSLGILGLIGLQATAIKYSVEAEDRNRAAMVANEIASQMWITNTVVLDTTTGTPSWDTKVKAALGAAATVTVIKSVDPTLPTTASITITWFPPQRTATESSKSQLVTRVTLPPPT